MRTLLPAAAMLLGLCGCGPTVESPSPTTRAQRWTAQRPVQPPEVSSSTTSAESDERAAKSSGAESTEPHVQSFNTGDCESWPRCEFPLVIEIDAPPVPPELTTPTPAITTP